jgi:hypothetical protein
MMPGMEGMMPGMEGMMPGVGPMRPGQMPQKLITHRLFRFIDRSVEPGKRYRYRVRLMLTNPNYGQNPRFLERLELGKSRYITTDWSEPTGVIEVPRDDRLLVRSVKPAIRITQEPVATVHLIKWVNEEGIEADKEVEKAVRGQLLDFPGCKFPEEERKPRPRPKRDDRNPIPGMPPGMEDMGMLMGPEAGGEPPEATMPTMPGVPGFEKEPIDVDYETDSLILDVRGGHRVDLRLYERGGANANPDLNAPSEVLILDPEGKLTVRSDLADEAEYDKLQERKEGPQGMMGPGMMGPGMPGMEMLMPGMEGMMPGMEGMEPDRDEKRGGRRTPKKREKRTGPLRG